MPKETSLTNLNEDLQSTSRELLSECDQMAKAAREYAVKENAYRLAKAMAMLKAEGKTVDMKKAEVDLICEKERLASHISEGVLDSTRERVRSLRAVLSALQTIAGSHKAEAQFDRTGPRF
jgi:hypothetical protein